MTNVAQEAALLNDDMSASFATKAGALTHEFIQLERTVFEEGTIFGVAWIVLEYVFGDAATPIGGALKNFVTFRTHDENDPPRLGYHTPDEDGLFRAVCIGALERLCRQAWA